METERAAVEPEAKQNWELAEGDEIAPGRHAVKRLGGGHRYEAYLAWDDHLHALVVIKVVRPHLVADEHTLGGLRGEARMLERLDHPVLLRGFDAVLEGPRPHLVLEHLEGPRLSSYLRRYGPLPVEQVVPLAVQVSAALHYLREESVVHLDVKPSNIIMGGPPRLIDLSVALDAGDAAELRHPVGTDAYMAPEQCDPVALGPVGAPADVWGIGVTLYRAATGSRPFPDPVEGAKAPAERYPQLTHEPKPPPPERIGPLLAEPIMSCLRREPAERPTAGALADELEPVLDELPKPRIGRLRPRWS
jgi:serine/threonine protein kinase